MRSSVSSQVNSVAASDMSSVNDGIPLCVGVCILVMVNVQDGYFGIMTIGER